MISAAELLGIVTIRGADEGALKLARVGESADSAGAKLAGLAVGGTALAGAAFVALGAKAAMMAGDFEQSITKLYTTAGEQQGKLKMVGQGILDMSVQVGTGAQELADAMYIVESGGHHGADGLNVLRMAAEAARAENASVTETAKALVFILDTYKGTAITAAGATNIMTAAVGLGVMTFQQFAEGIPNVLPVAAKFHISLTDIAAGLAVMTAQGDDATSAATHLRQIILALEAPTVAGTKALASIGLTTQQVSDAMSQSLPGAIQMITDDLGKKFPAGSTAYNEALKAIAGGNKQLLALLELSGPQLKTYEADVAAITGKTKEAGNSILGWAAIQDTFNFKIGQANAALQKLGIDAGNVLLPALKAMLDNVTPLIGRFDDWFVKSGREATVLSAISTGLSTLGNVIGTTASVIGNIAGAFQDAGATGTILRGALIALGIAFAAVELTKFMNGIIGTISFLKDLIPVLWATNAAAFGLIGVFALAAAAIVGAGYVAMNWDHIMEAVQSSVHQRGVEIGQGFSNMGTIVHNAFDVAGKATSTFAGAYSGNGTAIDTISKRIGDVFSGLGTLTKQAWGVTIAGSVASASASVQLSVANMQSGVSEHITEMTNTASMRAAQMRNAVANSAQGMYNAAADAASNMAAHVAGSALNMEQQVVRDFSVTESTASSLVQQLHDNVIGDFQNMDSLAKGYWDDVANYILDHPIEGSVNINVGGANAGSSATVHHYASGTNYAPGGASLVGEGGQAELVVGPHLMNLPTGAGVYPMSQVGGGSTSGRPVVIQFVVNGRQLAQAALPDFVAAIRDATGAKF